MILSSISSCKVIKREKGKMCKLCTMHRQERKHFSSYLHLIVWREEARRQCYIYFYFWARLKFRFLSLIPLVHNDWVLTLFKAHFTHNFEHPEHISPSLTPLGCPGGTSGEESAFQFKRCKRPRFNPWVGKIPWRRRWQHTPVLLPAKSHGQRSLVGYNPWGRKESDTTEWLDLTWCGFQICDLISLQLHDNLYILGKNKRGGNIKEGVRGRKRKREGSAGSNIQLFLKARSK